MQHRVGGALLGGDRGRQAIPHTPSCWAWWEAEPSFGGGGLGSSPLLPSARPGLSSLAAPSRQLLQKEGVRPLPAQRVKNRTEARQVLGHPEVL